jgi:alpha-tubulin suppressor-like RCC1 family protein
MTDGALRCFTAGSATAPTTVTGFSGSVSQVSTGYQYNGYGFDCALTAAGGVECWGDNTEGELGNGNTTASSIPGLVTGLTSGVSAIATGSDTLSACAIASGAVQCWGRNWGVLGDGTSAGSSDTPVTLTGFTGTPASLAIGGDATASPQQAFACTVTTAGGVQCWGGNSYGQLGDDSTTANLAPVQVKGLTSGVAAVAAGADFACALTTGGGVQCWGYNGYGQLGDGTTSTSSTPQQVMGLTSGVTAIAAGNSTACAILSGGSVECWGYNGSGELGDNSTMGSSVPTQVMTLTSGVTAIAVGSNFACAVMGGGVWCWGNSGAGTVPVHVTGFPG